MTQYSTVVLMEFEDDIKLTKEEKMGFRKSLLKMLNDIGPVVYRGDDKLVPHFIKSSPLERLAQ